MLRIMDGQIKKLKFFLTYVDSNCLQNTDFLISCILLRCMVLNGRTFEDTSKLINFAKKIARGGNPPSGNFHGTLLCFTGVKL